MYAWKRTRELGRDLQRIEALKGALDYRGVLPRRWAGRLRREVESASVAASTAMEGVPVTVDEVRRILAGDRPPQVSAEDAALVRGYREAMSYVLRRADDPSFRWQDELILGIHDRVLAGSWAAGAGRYRTGPVYLTDPLTARSVCQPPPAEDIPALVADLTSFLEQEGSGLEPPIQAALVHIRLTGIHPFADGNGRTARVLASLAMYRGGYRSVEFTSLEEWWGAHREDYQAAFRCLSTAWDPVADVTPFVVAHVRAQRLQADARSLRPAAEREIWTILEDIATEELAGPPRFADALYDAFFGREVTNRYYRGLADVSTATATNDLGRLEASGLLAHAGAGRSRTYHGTRRLLETVARTGRAAHVIGDPATPMPSLGTAIVTALAERLHSGRPATGQSRLQHGQDGV
jgi:Fic family protein